MKDKLNNLFIYQDGQLFWKKNKKLAGTAMNHGYWQIMINYKNYTRHRLIWIFHNGDIPDGMCIDHIDGNKRNDNIENLRLATHAQNVINSTKTRSTNPHRGIHWCKRTKKYEAHIGKDGKKIFLGRHNTIQEALNARQKAEISLYGEFSRYAKGNA